LIVRDAMTLKIKTGWGAGKPPPANYLISQRDTMLKHEGPALRPAPLGASVYMLGQIGDACGRHPRASSRTSSTPRSRRAQHLRPARR